MRFRQGKAHSRRRSSNRFVTDYPDEVPLWDVPATGPELKRFRFNNFTSSTVAHPSGRSPFVAGSNPVVPIVLGKSESTN
jgi:hypothetical protein